MRKGMKIRILGHKWSVRFLERSSMHQESNGTCWPLEKVIDIANDLGEEEARFVAAHELTHAFLAMGGRCFEDSMPQESVCETVAWHIGEIMRLRDAICSERAKKLGK